MFNLNFLARIWKYRCHIRNNCRQTCLIANCGAEIKILDPIQDGPFSGLLMNKGEQPPPPLPISKTCHIYPTIMRLGTVLPYLKKIQKIHKSCDIPLEFCWHLHFSPEVINFCYIKKYRWRLEFNTQFLIFFTFLFL